MTTLAMVFGMLPLALILRGALGSDGNAAAHVYPIYSNMRLIKLIDFQPIIAASAPAAGALTVSEVASAAAVATTALPGEDNVGYLPPDDPNCR